MKKSLRNKALREADRLITGTYGDQEWYTPGGWYATVYPIYEGYKVLNRQLVSSGKPDITPIINKLPVMVKATEFDYEQDPEAVFIRTIDMFNGIKVNALYLEFLKDIHPQAEIRISEQDLYAPVAFYENGELVALLMPMKR